MCLYMTACWRRLSAALGEDGRVAAAGLEDHVSFGVVEVPFERLLWSSLACWVPHKGITTHVVNVNDA